MSCKKCDGTNCFYTLNELYNIVLNIEKEVGSVVKRRINKYLNATSCEDSTEKLNLTKKVILDFIKEKLRTGDTCICNEHINKAVNHIREYIPRIQDIEVPLNRDKEEKWIIDNVQCTTKEKWKILAYKICRKLEVEITAEETLCNYALDITLNNITCDVLTVLSTANIECKNNTTVTVKEEDCKIEHQLLIENHSNGPDLSLYKLALKRYGLNYDQIKLIYDNGLTLGLNKLGNCTINTVIDSYDLTEITYNKVITEIP